MHFNDHCLISEIVFGSKCPEVHLWLDETFQTYKGSSLSLYNHWLAHHHIEGIEKRYKRNSLEWKVACLHVLCDWLAHFSEWNLPSTEQEAIESLSKRGIHVNY